MPAAPAPLPRTAPTGALDPRRVATAAGPLVELHLDDGGHPVAATAALPVAATPARLWDVLADVERYPERIPTVQQVQLQGDRLTMRLRFRLALLSWRFGYTATVTTEAGRAVDVRYLSGEPRALHMRFEVVTAADLPTPLLYVTVGFDIRSVGWLATFFLHHHPEIELGVLPGTALTLVDALRRAAEAAT